MILRSLYTTAEYLPNIADVALPLGVRRPNSKMAYVSTGIGGWILSIITFKNGHPISFQTEHGDTLSSPTIEELLLRAEKALPGSSLSAFFNGGKAAIAGCCKSLDFRLLSRVDTSSQIAFITQLRSEPHRVFSGPIADSTYIGLQPEGSISALVAGVNRAEVTAFEHHAKRLKLNLARKTIPVLSLFNLLLADERTHLGEYLPVVADQGVLSAVTIADKQWSNSVCTPFITGGAQPVILPEKFTEFSERLSGGLQSNKVLLACSVNNGGIDVAAELSKVGFEIVPFTVGSIKREDLFPYATSIF